MSRGLTEGLSVELDKFAHRPILMLELFFDTETLRFWSGVGEFGYDGNVFTGAGNLLSISPITETQTLEAHGMSCELSGIPSSMISLAMTEDYQDRGVTLTFGLLDGNGAVVPDPIAYRYKADQMNIKYGAETITVQLNAESDFIAARRISERRRTPEDHAIDYANDSFFDMVSSLQNKQIIFGQS